MSDRSRRGARSQDATFESTSTVASGGRSGAPGRAGRRHGLAAVLALAAALAAAASAAEAADARTHGSGPAPAAQVLSASAFSFERTVLRSDLPVIVDFWAPWCIVCRELDAPLAELAAKFAGRARVVRVNVDWSSRVARRYGVEALPTILVFKGGALVSRSTGGASAQDLEDLLTAQLAPTTPTTPAEPSPAAAVAAIAGR